MAWNPCCCWKLKDAAITIGIWSAVYSVAQIAMFGWQWGVLAQCEHVTMAQSNLQCEYWCPCVGASTARTSALVQGWQMAAIKYERDRAANTLLPNYNTYGRYDIPSYYESYWQSPEERFYTALFVIQVLCLIVSFFLLFASIAMIYGVHSWSRVLIWPWIAMMIASVLSSTAYCVCWWSGDVRDYWLVLTILEIFGVFINTYFIVVICVFYSRMQRELAYYEGKQRNKYDRFSPLDSTQTLEPEPDKHDGGYRNQWDDPNMWYPENKYPPPPPDPYLDGRSTYPYKKRYDDEMEMEPPPEPQQLPHSQSVPSFFDDSFRDVTRDHRHRKSHRHHSCSCHKSKRRHSHHHHRSKSRCRNKCDCSDAGSSEMSIGLSESTDSRCHRHKRQCSDDESDSSSHHCKHRSRSRNERRGPRQVKRDDREREVRHSSTQADPEESPTGPVPFIPTSGQGITIPQHIVIPPTDDTDGNPRKYHINSEITISYDPRQTSGSPRPETRASANGTTNRNQPVSITSNV